MDLIRVIEGFVAPQLGFFELRLDALDRPRLLEFYRELGYSEYSRPFDSGEWGRLVPMRKQIG